MPAELSSIATNIIVLLNNIKEICVKSQNRSMAKDAMKAVEIYAKENGFNLPTEKIQSFYDVLIDSRPSTLSSIIKDIASEIAMSARKKP